MTAARRGRYTACIGIVVAAVVLVGLVADLLIESEPGDTSEAVLWTISLDSDQSVPAWLASVLLLACSLLLGVAASLESQAGSRHAKSWWLLCAVFFLLSLDEVARLHETSGVLLNRLIPAVESIGGVFYFSWSIVGIFVIIFLGIVLLRWFLSLSWRTRLLFGGAAVLFISGALGFELLNSSIAERDDLAGQRSARYIVFTAVEEALEFAGALVFLYALLDHLDRLGVAVAISAKNMRW